MRFRIPSGNSSYNLLSLRLQAGPLVSTWCPRQLRHPTECSGEATAQRVDEEVREIVMRGGETARQVVGRHRGAVRPMADQLLLVESLDADGIEAIMASAA